MDQRQGENNRNAPQMFAGQGSRCGLPLADKDEIRAARTRAKAKKNEERERSSLY